MRVVSCAGSLTSVTLWLLDMLFGASFREVESRLLCAAASNCELVCAKLRSSVVFTSCVSTKRSDCRVRKFTLARYELMSLSELVVGGNPCGILAVGAVEGYCERRWMGSDAAPLRSAVLGRST